MAQVGDICVWFKTKSSGRGLERKIICRIQRRLKEQFYIRYWNEELKRYDNTRVHVDSLSLAGESEKQEFLKIARDYVQKAN